MQDEAGRPTRTMADSGASFSCMSMEKAKDLGISVKGYDSEQPSVCTGSGHNMYPVGYAEVPLFFGAHRFSIEFRIFTTLSHEIIWGNRELHKRKAKIDYDVLSLSLHDDKGERATIPISMGELVGVQLPDDLAVLAA